jgi:ammonium transporter, Amt family
MSYTVDSGDNAWVLVAGSLVMFMTPGVGFFYGGMVNKKNLLSTIAYCLLVFCIATITWALLGFSLAFSSQSGATGFIGDCTYCGLRNISLTIGS